MPNTGNPLTNYLKNKIRDELSDSIEEAKDDNNLLVKFAKEFLDKDKHVMY